MLRMILLKAKDDMIISIYLTDYLYPWAYVD